MTQSRRKGKGKSSGPAPEDDWSGEEIELKFDDPNITLAAFEICLSRLYSNNPILHFPTHHLPTPKPTLSPSYPPTGKSAPSLQALHQATPLNTHLATPRLLLSLLATTTYLGQTPLMREVLAMVLRTIGPHTVCRYLGFAIGDGVGVEEWEGQNEVGARGFDDVGESWTGHDQDLESLEDLSIEEDETGPIQEEERPGRDGEKVGYSPVLSRTTSHRSTGSTPTLRNIPFISPLYQPSMDDPNLSSESHERLPHFYGFVSNKIGEAVICWLSRWGADVLEHEDKGGPVIWGKGGIPASFVRALIGSDVFWVAGEMERYEAGRKVLDLRRRGWKTEGLDQINQGDGWEEDEEELLGIFEDIYYTHMTFDELSTIASDIDPETSLPYAPLHVIQAAHWSAANLKSRILAAGNAEEETSDLGLTVSTIDIVTQHSKRRRAPRSRMASPSSTQNTMNASTSTSTSSSTQSDVIQMTPGPPLSTELFHPVPMDDTYRIGAGGLLFLAALATSTTPLPGMPGLPDLGPTPHSPYPPDHDSKQKPRPPPQNESTHFGLSNTSRTTTRILSHSLATTETKWTRLPPFRFNVEFWGIHELLEKERAYSRSVFYGGSWWNVYVQTIRKKGVVGGGGQQLGVYLHRQSLGEGFPKVSNKARKGKNEVVEGKGEELSEIEAGEYEDPRRVVKAYFSITCSSALGTALIRFSSSPDSFTISQSWGWKSSALRSEEYLAGLGEGLESGMLGWVGDVPEGGISGGSLRACVVVGLI